MFIIKFMVIIIFIILKLYYSVKFLMRKHNKINIMIKVNINLDYAN